MNRCAVPLDCPKTSHAEPSSWVPVALWTVAFLLVAGIGFAVGFALGFDIALNQPL